MLQARRRSTSHDQSGETKPIENNSAETTSVTATRLAKSTNDKRKGAQTKSTRFLEDDDIESQESPPRFGSPKDPRRLVTRINPLSRDDDSREEVADTSAQRHTALPH